MSVQLHVSRVDIFRASRPLRLQLDALRSGQYCAKLRYWKPRRSAEQPTFTSRRGTAQEKSMTHIHVIHENAAWLEPLARALDMEGLVWRDWFLIQGTFDLSQPPPQGVFYNRMSASSH